MSQKSKFSQPDPEFRYFLTTRGLNKDGGLLSLDHLPEWFHSYVTVVSAAENRSAILNRYPSVSYWSSPDSVNTAARKRKFILEESPDDKFFIFNDEIRLSMLEPRTNKLVKCCSDPELFRYHILRMERLSEDYVGFSAGPRLFSSGRITSGKSVQEIAFVGAFFRYHKKFATTQLKLARLDYHEDVDYTLQTLALGYKTATYIGIFYEARDHKPHRQYADRTSEIQVRDTARLMKFFPGIVSEKAERDLEVSDTYINVRWKDCYSPISRVLFVCHGNINRSAAAEIFVRRKFRYLDVRSCGLKENAGGEITAAKTRRALATLGIETDGIRSTPISKKLVDWADIVFYMDDRNLASLLSSFPDSKSKFVSLGSWSGLRKIKDPGFSSDPQEVLSVIKQVMDSIREWVRGGFEVKDKT